MSADVGTFLAYGVQEEGSVESEPHLDVVQIIFRRLIGSKIIHLIDDARFICHLVYHRQIQVNSLFEGYPGASYSRLTIPMSRINKPITPKIAPTMQ